jgi:signal transduction histidine kinase
VLSAVLGAVRRSWITVGAVALLQTAVLFAIVWRSGGKFDSQRAALVAARRAAVETNERFLRRIGADLHDGPAQLISLALLRLDSLRPVLGDEHARPEEFEKIQTLLESCLQEIREMSSGLAPPRLEGLHLQKMLELTIREHEQRTGTTVDAVIGTLPADVPVLYKVSIYRFVQQALHNAYRHGGGVGQVVHAASEGSALTIQVADAGPGIAPLRNGGSERLGLACMRDRIESLGGTFWLETRAGVGTTVRASFALDDIVKPDPTG